MTFKSPLEDWDALKPPGVRLSVKRDDLLPFPMAGNKARKVLRELRDVDIRGKVVVTVGSVSSNHCRTTALMAARAAGRAHLVLHGGAGSLSERTAIALLRSMGASYEIVEADRVSEAVERARFEFGKRAHFIAGGCHTRAGVESYADAVKELAGQIDEAPDWIVHASGTGATQAGIVTGCRRMGWRTRIVGVSVARAAGPGTEAVREALDWVGLAEEQVLFDDSHRAGGYGRTDETIETTLKLAWAAGMPLDGTYTGKAFSALPDLVRDMEMSGRVVFWHTGGLMNHLWNVMEGSFRDQLGGCSELYQPEC